MALISCPECNTQVSDRAETCVSCGTPIYDKKQDYNLFRMKKEGYKSILKVFIYSCVMMFFVLSMYAVGGHFLFSKLQLGLYLIAMFALWAFPLAHYRKIDTKKIKKDSWLAFLILLIIYYNLAGFLFSVV